MKNLKNFIILATMLTTTACSSQKPNADGNVQPESTPKTTPLQSESAIPTPPPTPVPEVPKPTEEILNATVYNGEVQIGDTVFTLPITLEEVLKVCSIADKEKTEEALVDPLGSDSIKLRTGSSELYAYVHNSSDKLEKIKTCQVTSISTNDTGVFFPKGLVCGDSIDQLEEKWGEYNADESVNDKLVYVYNEYPFRRSRLPGSMGAKNIVTATGNTYKVMINKNTGKITNIQYTAPYEKAITSDWSVVKNGVLEFKTMSGEEYAFNYSLPAKLVPNSLVWKDAYVGVAEIVGKEYIVVADMSIAFLPTTKETLSDDELLKELKNMSYDSNQILFNEGIRRAIVGYKKENGAIQASVYSYVAQRRFITYIGIYTVDESDEISEEAKNFFEELVKNFASSISIVG